MCRADMTENVKISDNDKIFGAKFEARHICDGCGEASLVSEAGSLQLSR